MTDILFIEKNPDLLESQDYAALKQQGIDHIQALAHRLWTDYNVHDPGITILELLCYAITDLGYRTDYAVEDLLARRQNGETVTAGTFHTARDIFPCNPVTFEDLRKLLIDIAGVRNAWIEKHSSVIYWLDAANETLMDGPAPGATKNPPVNGLYDVFIEYEEDVEDARVVHLGLLERTNDGAYIAPGGRGIAFHVEYELTLQAVHVYARRASDPARPVDVTVRLLDSDGTEVDRVTDTVDTPDEKARIPLNFTLTPGRNYRLIASGADLELVREPEAGFPFSIDNVIHLVSGVLGTTPQQPYFFFYDWEVNYAVPPPTQIPEYTEDLVIETVGLEDNTGRGRYVAVQSGGAARGIQFDVARPVTLEAVSVYADAPGNVAVRLTDADGVVLASAKGTVLDADTKTRIPLWFKIAPGTGYRLDAVGAGVQLYRMQDVDFPYELEGVLTLQRGRPNPALYFFFFDWEVSYLVQSGLLVEAPTITKEDIRLEVLHRLHAHRNLCEDFVNACELRVEEIGVCADLELTPSAGVEEVLAEIFYQLGRFVSPPVSFYTIQELLDKGKTPDEIFEGPLLDHGFIDDDEFRQIQRRCRLRASDIIQIIMDIEGVKSVKTLSLLSFIDDAPLDSPPRAQDDWILDLATDAFRAPSFEPKRSKIVFYKNGLPYYANRQRVLVLLAEKKAQDAAQKLKNHERDLEVPVGTFKDLADYYPIQNELPATYMVGRYRVPASYPDLRKAQARQLRAYLLFFEQFFANYLAQLANVDRLFSWTPGPVRTYFTQEVDEIVDVEEVFADYPALAGDLAAIIEDTKTAQERKLRFLEHLVARFAESLVDYGLLVQTLYDDEAEGRARVIEDKRLFLTDYPKAGSERGKGFDIRYPDVPANLSGYQRRVYRLLGFRNVRRRHLAGHRFEIVKVADDRWRFLLRDEAGAVVFTSVGCETRSSIEVLLDFALTLGGYTTHYAYRLTGPCGADPNEIIGMTTAGGDTEERWMTAMALLSAGFDADHFAVRSVEDDRETKWYFIIRDERGQTIFVSTRRDTKAAAEDLLNCALTLGGDAANYSMHLVRQCRGGRDEVIGDVASQGVWPDVVAYFAGVAGAEGFHVVEHVLLRKRTTADPFLRVQLNPPGACTCVEVREPYSFRASVLLPSWPVRFQNINFRKLVEETLRMEAPAHVYLKICWISHDQMKAFETCHDAWLDGLAALALDGKLGPCHSAPGAVASDAGPWRSGQLPLPAMESSEEEGDGGGPEAQTPDERYRDAVDALIEKLHGLDNVFPLARLHDCRDTDGDAPQISLNNTNLGTF